MDGRVNGSRGAKEGDIGGRMVPCPDCETPTGVALPQGSTIVRSAGGADGFSLTECPNCHTQFEVRYTVDQPE